jgi:hypothetical protein
MRYYNKNNKTTLRNNQTVQHYVVPTFPNIRELIENTFYDEYIWKAGDHYSNIAFQYYGDVRLWWVIAWFNHTPLESLLATGDVILIPKNIDYIMSVMG